MAKSAPISCETAQKSQGRACGESSRIRLAKAGHPFAQAGLHHLVERAPSLDGRIDGQTALYTPDTLQQLHTLNPRGKSHVR